MRKTIIYKFGGARAAANRVVSAFASRKLIRKAKTDLSACANFCLFVGPGRTGSTLLGALLNAHPEIAIANEVLLVTRIESDLKFHGPRYTRLGRAATLAYFVNQADANRRTLRQSGYDYAVNFRAAKAAAIKVVGDKAAAATAEAIIDPSRFSRLERLFRKWRLNPRFIGVARNPYDVITTMCVRRASQGVVSNCAELKIADLAREFKQAQSAEYIGARLEKTIQRVDDLNRAIARLQSSDSHPLLAIRYEDLVADPRAVIKTACDFLGVACASDYLDACAAVVKPVGASRRLLGDFWTPERQAAVQALCAKYPWLQGYSYDA